MDSIPEYYQSSNSSVSKAEKTDSKPAYYQSSNSSDSKTEKWRSKPSYYESSNASDSKTEDTDSGPAYYQSSYSNVSKTENTDSKPAYYHSGYPFMNSKEQILNKFSELDEDVSAPIISNLPNVTHKSIRKCADCKKPPQMQCLHCSKHVCMDCAQKHVALANEQVDVVQHVLNEKMSIIDRLSAAAKEHVTTECDKIIKQTEIERVQAFAQIDQLAEQQKNRVQAKNTQLNELSLDEIPSFIQCMTSEMEYIVETNNQLFHIKSTLPKIQVQQRLSSDKQKV